MTKRFDVGVVSKSAMETMSGLERYIRSKGMDPVLLELLQIRASQLNGCAYCLDMHLKMALDKGEDARRLLLLPTWEETPFFSDKERAVLRFTEAVTLISKEGVPDKVYDEMRRFFDEAEIVNIIMAINTINSWNRLMITSGAQIEK